MRKMTYTQAATCSENLKARVTPEQSEKMQRAWFAAGKTWVNGSQQIISETTEVFMYLDGDNSCNLARSIDFKFFKQCNYEEIKLIDDIPKCVTEAHQSDFASQQDVLAWLSDEKNKVSHLKARLIVGFKNGRLWDFTDNLLFDGDFFTVPEHWQKHIPPRLSGISCSKNPSVVFRENRLNEFTCAIVERFEKSGKKHVLVETLNGAIFNVVVSYADQDFVDVNDDTELGSIIGFRTEDHQYYWGLNGYSSKNNDYDLYSLVR